MAWWTDANGVQRWDGRWQDAPMQHWGQPGVFGVPIAAERFSQFDPGGDFDVDGIPGFGLNDYNAFLGTYLGGDAANFGQPGYEEGTAFLTTPRVMPQATPGAAYQQVQLPGSTNYYGSQQNAANVAFKQNNPVTASQYLNAETIRDSAAYNANKYGKPTPPLPAQKRKPTLLGGY